LKTWMEGCSSRRYDLEKDKETVAMLLRGPSRLEHVDK